jgi:hypothetical protein
MSANAGIRVEKISAVDASTFVAYKHPNVSLGTAHNIRFKTRRSVYEIDSPGAVGCSLSHFKIWKMLLSTSAPAMIVFEDDVEIPRDFKERYAKIMEQTPQNWDIIQLQQTRYSNGKKGCAPMREEEPWELCTSLMGTFAYIVSREGAKKLLERAYPIELHVDAYMAYMSRMGYCKMIWHPLLDMNHNDGGKSNIDHGSCSLCDVPSNLEKEGIVVLSYNSVIGIMTMAAIVGAILTRAFSKKRIFV